jgi:glutamine amidotransferase
MIVIVDYGMGNLRSVLNKFERMGVEAVISSRVEEISKAEKLVLPGVGHFGKAMNNLAERGHIKALGKKVLKDKVPILGICLGMQLFSHWSEEGCAAGLGWINAETFRFDPGKMKRPLKIPHMGWNSIKKKKNISLLDSVNEKDTFYFVHSYHVVCKDPADIVALTEYGYDFTSVIQRENIYGTQFHPEKSHKRGFQILKNFTEIKTLQE